MPGRTSSFPAVGALYDASALIRLDKCGALGRLAGLTSVHLAGQVKVNGWVCPPGFDGGLEAIAVELVRQTGAALDAWKLRERQARAGRKTGE